MLMLNKLRAFIALVLLCSLPMGALADSKKGDQQPSEDAVSSVVNQRDIELLRNLDVADLIKLHQDVSALAPALGLSQASVDAGMQSISDLQASDPQPEIVDGGGQAHANGPKKRTKTVKKYKDKDGNDVIEETECEELNNGATKCETTRKTWVGILLIILRILIIFFGAV